MSYKIKCLQKKYTTFLMCKHPVYYDISIWSEKNKCFCVCNVYIIHALGCDLL